jgi:hypothetical protein
LLELGGLAEPRLQLQLFDALGIPNSRSYSRRSSSGANKGDQIESWKSAIVALKRAQAAQGKIALSAEQVSGVVDSKRQLLGS